MIDKYPDKDCNGCKICAELCPQQAITYHIKKDGFWYPHVNNLLCNNCRKCINYCPQKTPVKLDKSIKKVYAAWTKNNNIRCASTSGGLFFELASGILKSGGVWFRVEGIVLHFKS